MGHSLIFARTAGSYNSEMGQLPERFWNKVRLHDNGECWEWTAARTCGYGRFKQDGKLILAHRAAFEALCYPIPDSLYIDHLCRVRECVNPCHLEPVTLKENILRGESAVAHNARKTHCSKGHPLEGENLVPYDVARGHRSCLTCQRERRRLDYATYRR